VTATSSLPEQAPPEVAQAAERAGLGGLDRVLTRLKRHILKADEVTSRIYEFAEGIVYQDADNGVHAFPWEQVVTVYLGSTALYTNGRYIRTFYTCRLVLGNGRRVKLWGHFKDPALSRGRKQLESDEEHQLFLLLSAAARVISQSLLPDAIAQLNRGEDLAFGDITMSLAGVKTSTGLVPWSEITAVQAGGGYIRIKRGRKSISLSKQQVSEIPNAQLFFLLAATLRKSQGQRQ
jgi:hypothetical protein